MSAHALLSPSSASRWLACTPSARLEAERPDKAGDAADEGTLAHKLGELMIKRQLKLVSEVNFKSAVKAIEKNKFYSDSMWEHCEDYCSFVIEEYNEALARDPHAVIFIEEKLDLTHLIPEGFGTGDIIIVSSIIMKFIDLKYGKGVRVQATGNKQLKLYALGAYEAHSLMFDIERVQMMIYQPRMDNFSSFEMTVEELLEWGLNEVKPKAELAWRGEGEFNPGEHCQFCKIKATCAANANHHMSLAKYAFEDPTQLNAADIADILEKAPAFKNWIKAVERHALYETVQNGAEWPGFKLVAGKSNRVITDSAALIETLEKAKLDKALFMSAPELLGIGALEKNIGKKKFGELAAKYIKKPQGKPVLVSVDDPRPILNSAEAAADAFKDDEDIDN